MRHADFWAPYTGAVSLTFDDGHPTQLKKALPMLDTAELKASFYLNPHGENWQKRLAPWCAVSEKGHEIGNHTLSHRCSNNLTGKSGGLEDQTLDTMAADIQAAQERLTQIAPHQKEWTFCYPCYQEHVGRGANRQTYVPLIAKQFLAGRGRGEYGFANHIEHADLACLAATNVELMSGHEMIGLVESLAGVGLWVILVFHEIDGPFLSNTSHDFQLLVDHLVRRRESIWCASVVEVARKVAAFQADLADHTA